VPDTDGDGLPDAWETSYMLNPFWAGDVALDSHGDGHTNWQEFRAGTSPRAKESHLKVALTGIGAGVVLEFVALANKTYTVQHTDSLANPDWQDLIHLGPYLSDRVESVEDNAPLAAARYYRLVTPWLR
jgi:hypothetical protein